jgi:3'-phosphoadenosine 5'-phosphosulfate sulfotransferase (PAPS reductase)/FAD synthetase
MPAQLTLFTPAAPAATPPKRGRRIHPSVPLTPSTTVPDELMREADWIVISSSGGKDSQAMAAYVVSRAKSLGLLERVVVVHADLGDIEWSGTRQLAEEQARLLGVRRFEVVRATGGDLLARTLDRYAKLKTKAQNKAREEGSDPATAKAAPAWPSSAARWCTSWGKMGPIWTLYTRLTRELSHLGRPVRILSCIGQRAAESAPRARMAAVEVDRAASNGRRHITTWRPIHQWTDTDVWRQIARSGLPYHSAYDYGMRRLSCSFCVLACAADLTLAARLRPAKAREYAAVETTIGADFKKGLSMREIIQRAATLEAAHGPLTKPPSGTTMAGHIGKKETDRYLARLRALRAEMTLAT